jgi:hypothetical protein
MLPRLAETIFLRKKDRPKKAADPEIVIRKRDMVAELVRPEEDSFVTGVSASS